MTAEREESAELKHSYDLEKQAIAISVAQEQGDLVEVETLFRGMAVIKESGLKWYTFITSRGVQPIFFGGHCDTGLLDELYLGTKLKIIETPDIKPPIFEGRELKAVAAVLIEGNYFYRSPSFHPEKYQQGVLNKMAREETERKAEEEKERIRNEQEEKERLAQVEQLRRLDELRRSRRITTRIKKLFK